MCSFLAEVVFMKALTLRVDVCPKIGPEKEREIFTLGLAATFRQSVPGYSLISHEPLFLEYQVLP